MSNGKIKKFLLAHNEEKSRAYSDPGVTSMRRLYRQRHPTEIAALKCMDGRINIPLITGIPKGIIQPFRNLGGRFDLGWPYFGQLMQEWEAYAISKGRKGIVFITYHWSKSHEHRGCAGFGYKKEDAIQHTIELHDQFERVFGREHAVVHPIRVGIETDEDSMVLHGKDDYRLDLAKEANTSFEELRIKVEKLDPSMDATTVNDLLNLVWGNIEHRAEVLRSKRPVQDVEHKENVLALGRGFTWLHIPNKAIIIAPLMPDQTEPIEKGARIILNNLKTVKGLKKDGAVLLFSVFHREPVGPEKTFAIEKADSLAFLAIKTIKERVPELLPHLDLMIGTTDNNTLKFTSNETENSKKAAEMLAQFKKGYLKGKVKKSA